ncbi:MAG: sialic acid synthase SpsE [Parasphingorhabdus sp.]|jgi:sialic acid synthase SpsE
MFIISEIAPQFGDDLDLAEQMILQSKMAGAKAAKVQLYPADLFSDNPEPYLRARELSFDDFKRLKNYGDSIGLPVFATAFTDECLDWCRELNQKYFKIAARTHLENPDLVSRILDLRQTVFVSVPSTLDISKVKILDNCIYLHCVVQYPTLLEDMIIPDFKNSIFDGISDHSIGISAALCAAAHGATYLEKHFTVSAALQRSNEKAHVGGMTYGQLDQIVNLSREMKLIGTII